MELFNPYTKYPIYDSTKKIESMLIKFALTNPTLFFNLTFITANPCTKSMEHKQMIKFVYTKSIALFNPLSTLSEEMLNINPNTIKTSKNL